jgi:hypothetical protein
VNCDDEPVTGDAVVQEVGGRPKISWWQVLRVVLVLGWIAWAAITWWAAPRESTADQVRADIAAQRLTYYEWGDGWKNDGGLVSPFPVWLRDGDGSMLLWHTTDGRRHYLSVDEPTAGAGLGPEASALDQQLQAYEGQRPVDPPVGAVVSGLLIAGAVLGLWALVSGPDPVIGTRWFWFWLVSGVPFGLGALWWLARERPWSSRAPVRDRRLKWWAGIGIGFVASLVIGLALMGLRRVVGDDVVPFAG